MTRKRKLSIFLLAVTAIVAWTVLTPVNMSDRAMIKRFSDHRDAMEKLRIMAAEDRKVIRIANDFTWIEGNPNWPRPLSMLGFSMERWEVYKTLFKKASIREGISRTQDLPDAIFFIASASGLVTGGSEKGYAFLPAVPAKVYDSLDKLPADSKSNIPSFKHLDGNWYLYSSWDD